LQAEGEVVSPAQVRTQLQKGYQTLETALPEDIRLIYLAQAASLQANSQVNALSA
jgi:hypothetical protein